MLSRCYRRPSPPWLAQHRLLPLMVRRQPYASWNRRGKKDETHEDIINEVNSTIRRTIWGDRVYTLITVALTGWMAWVVYGYVRPSARDELEEGGQQLRMVVSANTFQHYLLLHKQPVSSTLSIYHLKARPGMHTAERADLFNWAWANAIWNLSLKQPQIQVVRSYTPLPPNPDQNDAADLRFLIRHDAQGEVSSWLQRLPAGSDLELRGPVLESGLRPRPLDTTFLAGGSGIATALQVAHVLFHEQLDSGDTTQRKPRMHILWACRKREDCEGGISDNSTSSFGSIFSRGSTDSREKFRQGLIVKELEALKAKYPGQVTVDYFVDEENTFINTDAVAKSLAKHTPSSRGWQKPGMVIISGPDGFVGHYAGPKQWVDRKQQQGPVLGVVREAALKVDASPNVLKV